MSCWPTGQASPQSREVCRRGTHGKIASFFFFLKFIHQILFDKQRFSDIVLRDIADGEVKITNTENIGKSDYA